MYINDMIIMMIISPNIIWSTSFYSFTRVLDQSYRGICDCSNCAGAEDETIPGRE